MAARANQISRPGPCASGEHKSQANLGHDILLGASCLEGGRGYPGHPPNFVLPVGRLPPPLSIAWGHPKATHSVLSYPPAPAGVMAGTTPIC